MERDCIRFNGKDYPTISIEGSKIDPECETDAMYTICDIDLWDALRPLVDDGNDKAYHIDEQVFFYCDNGFVASEPTEQEVIDYFKDIVL